MLVEVAVALPVAGTYTYEVPEALASRVRPGVRVLVPFGGRRVTGVVARDAAPLAEGAAPRADLRAVREVLDDVPAVDPALLELCLWIADYYEAPPGEVLRAALPAGTQVAAKDEWQPTDAGAAALRGEATGAVPRALLEALRAVASGKPAGKHQAALVERAWITRGEARRDARVKMKTVRVARLARELVDDDRAAHARAPRRLAVLEALTAGPRPAAELSRDLPGAAAALRVLEQAGLVVLDAVESRRSAWDRPAPAPTTPPPPTPGQAVALAALLPAVAAGTYAPFLLHGVTGSGKTEVYLQVIAEALARGRGAIVLVPEIALTPQLSSRFRARFGEQVAVLHSGLSPGERFDEWRRLHDGSAKIALGARSAIFAPVADLAVVVVDEEHDPSFKQEEGVRYHARDVALVRAQRAGAVCLLGSATPSLESWANAAPGGRFTRLTMGERPMSGPDARPLPAVELIDLRVHQADGESFLTAPLRAAIGANLAAGEQTILFLNRRGFATFVVCTGCGHQFRCPDCSVSLTYHRFVDQLRCHYCGHAEGVPKACPTCHGTDRIKRMGLGTEKVELALAEIFPTARVGRLDRDTAAGKGLADVLDRVNARELDILVGTQMVTKGHDFPGVTLVGVLLADAGLGLPDFRAGERTFQLLAQVAGRAGRGDRPGKVLVQTYTPEHPALVAAVHHDFPGFAASEIATREELGYPPHGRVVALRMDGPSEEAVQTYAGQLAVIARKLVPDGVTLLGPSEAPLKRLKGRTRWQLWLRGSDRALLRTIVRRLLGAAPAGRGAVRLTVDVDPVSTL